MTYPTGLVDWSHLQIVGVCYSIIQVGNCSLGSEI